MTNYSAAKGTYQHAAKAMERALFYPDEVGDSEPIFVLTFAYTESERRFADCYAFVALRECYVHFLPSSWPAAKPKLTVFRQMTILETVERIESYENCRSTKSKGPGASR
jgi:hypothetical protein